MNSVVLMKDRTAARWDPQCIVFWPYIVTGNTAVLSRGEIENDVASVVVVKTR
jgi:hypothetical protein